MKNFIHKLRAALRMVGVYENWPAVAAYRLNIRPQSMIVSLRDGSRFKVRDRRNELSDAYVINESYLYGIHNKILPYLIRAKTGIDIGAHIGAFSVFAAMRSPARIFAFEPAPNNFALLEQNIVLNKLGGRIHPLRLAVGGRSGNIKLYMPRDSGFATTKQSHLDVHGIHKEKSFSTAIVPVRTLAEVFREHRIEFCDFIKMDCEGSEYDILYNTPPKTLRNIGVMTIEFHGDGDIRELTDFLRRHNFEVERPSPEFAEIFCRNRAPRFG